MSEDYAYCLIGWPRGAKLRHNAGSVLSWHPSLVAALRARAKARERLGHVLIAQVVLHRPHSGEGQKQ